MKQPSLPQGAQYINIDRFEGVFAVVCLSDDTFVDLPRTALPQGAKAGDWLVQYSDGSYQIDEAYTKQRRDDVKQRLQALLNRKKKNND